MEEINGSWRNQRQGIFLQMVEAKVNKCGNVNGASDMINNVHRSVGSEKRKEDRSVARTPNANISTHPEKQILLAKNKTATNVVNCSKTIPKNLRNFKIHDENIILKICQKLKLPKLTRT